MSSCEKIDVHFEVENPRKWCYPLKEDVFMSPPNVLGGGSLFSPLLFGKFFDPSDAFPLWEFDSESLLHASSGQNRSVDWFQTEDEYVLKAQLPEPSSKVILEVCIESGKILEINAERKKTKKLNDHRRQDDDWKCSSSWWEHGYVRRIELPPNDQTDWRRTEAYVKNDVVLELKIPKISSGNSL